MACPNYRLKAHIISLLAIVVAACFPSANTELKPPPVAEYSVVEIAHAEEHPLNIKEWSPDEVEAEAYKVATEHKLDADLFVRVVHCESHGVKDAIGDNGTSFGAVQIHAPSHPEISQEQAENPAFALEWMAEQWSAGRAGMWSCYRKLR